MGLIYWLNLESGDHQVEEIETSMIYGSIDKKYLSDTYDLDQFSTIAADVINVREGQVYWGNEENLIPYLRELQISPLNLMLVQYKLVSDRLYILKDSWATLRDLGIFAGSAIKIKISVVKSQSGEEVAIFPRRDVSP